MFVIINELPAAPEAGTTFEDRFSASMRDTLPDVPGLHRAALLRPDQEDRHYVAIMEFDDRAAYDAYLASAHFGSSHGNTDRAKHAGRDLTTYHTTTVITPAA